jgi:hypothetical protein
MTQLAKKYCIKSEAEGYIAMIIRSHGRNSFDKERCPRILDARFK